VGKPQNFPGHSEPVLSARNLLYVAKEETSSSPAFRQINPRWISHFNQVPFLFSSPTLELPFTLYGDSCITRLFKTHKPVNVVLIREAIHDPFAMLPRASE
jgi:hypothetical protein